MLARGSTFNGATSGRDHASGICRGYPQGGILASDRSRYHRMRSNAIAAARLASDHPLFKYQHRELPASDFRSAHLDTAGEGS